jgi:hypothetical protein
MENPSLRLRPVWDGYNRLRLDSGPLGTGLPGMGYRNCWIRGIYQISWVLLVLPAFALADQTAQTRKEQYELAERCGNALHRVYDRPGWPIFKELRNHYNQRLNRCLVLMEESSNLKDGTQSVLVVRSVFDFNEGRVYGQYIERYWYDNSKTFHLDVEACNVEANLCHTRAEWDALIRPYMED